MMMSFFTFSQKMISCLSSSTQAQNILTFTFSSLIQTLNTLIFIFIYFLHINTLLQEHCCKVFPYPKKPTTASILNNKIQIKVSNRLIIFHHIKLMSDSFYLWTQRYKQSLDKVDTMNLKSSKFV